MRIPERVQLKSPMTIGINAVLGACFTGITFLILFALNVPFQSYGIAAFALVVIPTIIGAQIDRMTMRRNKTEQMNLKGFAKCKFSELDTELIKACKRMEPRTFNSNTSKSIFRGILGPNELVLMLHEISDGESTTRYTLCAAWTPIDLSPTIIRRRRFKDRISLFKDGNEHPLGDFHVIESQDNHFISTIEMMHPWFALKQAKPRNFRIHQPPGINEQWSMNGHWVVYADLGNADTHSMLKLAEFLATFVEQLEANFQSNP